MIILLFYPNKIWINLLLLCNLIRLMKIEEIANKYGIGNGPPLWCDRFPKIVDSFSDRVWFFWWECFLFIFTVRIWFCVIPKKYFVSYELRIVLNWISWHVKSYIHISRLKWKWPWKSFLQKKNLKNVW